MSAIDRHDHAQRLSRKITETERLRARLLEGGKPFTDPPPGWQAWEVPEPREPIDEAVKALVEKARAPRLRGRDELARDWAIACPFWTARAEVVAAVELAGGAQFDHGEARTAIEPSRKADAAKLARAHRLAVELADLLRDPAVARAVAGHPERVIDDRVSGSRVAFAVEAIATASRIPEAIEYVRQGAVAPEIGALERAFASRLAVLFERLTGKPPGKGVGPFVSFLCAAGETAGVQADWENVARKILAP
jgi:hypothetical protein